MKNKDFATLLFEARKERGLTQDALCKLIGVGDKSNISKSENGIVIPSPETVKKIVQAYDDPVLGYVYLQQCTELGNMILPPIMQGELVGLTLKFQKEYNDIQHIQMDMIDIACDSIVEEHEEDKMEESTK